MTDSYKLDTFDFKNRPWLFFIAVPLIFILFGLTFGIYSSILTNTNTIFFYLTFILFLIEVHFLKVFLSEFRYIPTETLLFDNDTLEYENQLKDWKDIKNMHFYYSGDYNWNSIIPFLTPWKSYNRYNNLHWFLIKKMDYENLDKVEIDGHTIFVKIRNAQEKKTFFILLRIAKEKGIGITGYPLYFN